MKEKLESFKQFKDWWETHATQEYVGYNTNEDCLKLFLNKFELSHLEGLKIELGGIYHSLDNYFNTTEPEPEPSKKHSHYYKPCPYEEIDVYRVIDIFKITDPCIQHAVKKLLVAGGRGHKNIDKDIQDVIDTCERWKSMRKEDENLSV